MHNLCTCYAYDFSGFSVWVDVKAPRVAQAPILSTRTGKSAFRSVGVVFAQTELKAGVKGLFRRFGGDALFERPFLLWHIIAIQSGRKFGSPNEPAGIALFADPHPVIDDMIVLGARQVAL